MSLTALVAFTVFIRDSDRVGVLVWRSGLVVIVHIYTVPEPLEIVPSRLGPLADIVVEVASTNTVG